MPHGSRTTNAYLNNLMARAHELKAPKKKTWGQAFTSNFNSAKSYFPDLTLKQDTPIGKWAARTDSESVDPNTYVQMPSDADELAYVYGKPKKQRWYSVAASGMSSRAKSMWTSCRSAASSCFVSRDNGSDDISDSEPKIDPQSLGTLKRTATVATSNKSTDIRAWLSAAGSSDDKSTGGSTSEYSLRDVKSDFPSESDSGSDASSIKRSRKSVRSAAGRSATESSNPISRSSIAQGFARPSASANSSAKRSSARSGFFSRLTRFTGRSRQDTNAALESCYDSYIESVIKNQFTKNANPGSKGLAKWKKANDSALSSYASQVSKIIRKDNDRYSALTECEIHSFGSDADQDVTYLRDNLSGIKAGGHKKMNRGDGLTYDEYLDYGKDIHSDATRLHSLVSDYNSKKADDDRQLAQWKEEWR